MPFLSYAQNAEDVVLWRALGDVENGFYVDVGAAHPDEDSVTRAFYDRGWRGINIEPVPAMARQLADARPRDVTLAVAAGAVESTVTLHVLHETGLSTVEPEILASLGDAASNAQPIQVPIRPLTSILDECAPDRIDFLKIDVEGAERAVLEGVDFRRHRPRVVLVEATWPNTRRQNHQSWEHLLLQAHYRFVLFDGLNRFYVSEEWADALAPFLAAPANVLDDFVRMSEGAAAHRLADVESQLGRAMARAKAAEDSARAAYARAFEQARDVGGLLRELKTANEQRSNLEREQRDRRAHAQELERRIEALTREKAEAERLLADTRASTSWRVTGPLRAVSSLMRGKSDQPIADPAPNSAAPDASPPAEPVRTARSTHSASVPVQAIRAPGPLRTVHQFHSGSATGDAITNSMLLIRRQLRHLGYRSEIFVEHRDPALAGTLYLLEDLPQRPDHVLIVHHSMGYDAIERMLAHRSPKLLYYHNITRPEMLPADTELPAYAALGREQLLRLKQAVVASVAASDYNAVELRRAGFDPVLTSTLLVDVDGLRARAQVPPPRDRDHPFTVLFVGRVIESKGQADLVAAFGRFRDRLGRPARLVLVGRTDSPGTYLQTIDDRMREHRLEAELVVTGAVSTAELDAQYAAADLYVSLSQHEGFGVPLLEAVAHGVPVLAWPGGGVGYTLGGRGLLPSRDPDAVAAVMLEVAQDPARRAALLAEQQTALDRFRLDRQWPAMQQALAAAGAAPPPQAESARTLAANMHFAVFGHTVGSYSLAAVNRDLAAALETERPGRVRLIPVEEDIGVLPAWAQRLAARAPAETGPEVVVSQHYPVRVPPQRGDLTLALVFWEESLLPPDTIAALDEAFDAVLAPSSFVAKALMDSGLTRPVHVIGQAPDLAPFEAIGRERGSTPADRDGTFTFLHVSSCFPRKGVDALLAAYARAFRRADPVRLLIKSFPNPHNTVADQVASLQRQDPEMAAVEVIDRDLDIAAVQELYRRADAMVLPTRGEGFNLPAAEAMAAGLPLIVTGTGGHMEFCSPDTARLLKFRRTRSRSHLASGHSLWAEPDHDDLVAALRECENARRDPDAAAELKRRTQRARAAVRDHTETRPMVRRLQAAALDVLARPPPEPIVVAWVSSWAVRCGVAQYLHHLIAAMPAHPGVAAHVVLADDRTEPAPDGSPQARPAWRHGDPASVDHLCHAITHEDARVVVIQHQPGLISWPMLAALLSSPALADRVVMVTLHSTAHLLERPDPERRRVVEALGSVARVMVHSLADLDRLQDLGVFANTMLLPHGVREPLPRTPWRDPGAAPLIGCYGFLLPGKGIGELIEAVALLRSSRPQARLRLVNADYGAAMSREEIARCRTLAEELHLEDAVEWRTDFLPDEASLDLLAPCDAIVIPTQASREGSSAAVRTALAAGPPVLVTPLGVFDDVGDAVARAEGTGPPDLAAGLEALLSDPQGREQLQASAERWMRSRAWRDIATTLQGTMLGLVEAQRKVRGTPTVFHADDPSETR